MEFIIGSNLAPTQPSTPTEIRHWGAAPHNILQRNILPESYSVISAQYGGRQESSQNLANLSTNSSCAQLPVPITPTVQSAPTRSVTSNHALTAHHDDSQHLALEISQHSPPIHPSFLPTSSSQLPPSASYSQLPQHQFVAINNQVHPYYPFTSAHFHRSVDGPVLVKVGHDDEVNDIDLSARLGQNVVARGYLVANRKDIIERSKIPESDLNHLESDQSGLTSDQKAFELTQLKKKYSLFNAASRNNLTFGGDLTFNAPTYSLGVKYNSMDDFVGIHTTKSINLNSISPASSTTPSLRDSNDNWGTLDLGMEYWIKVQDLQDTFTLGLLYSKDEYHGNSQVPNVKQYLIKKDPLSQPFELIPQQNSSISAQNNDNFDVFTTSIIPTSFYVDVNGVGAMSMNYATNLSDTLDTYSSPNSTCHFRHRYGKHKHHSHRHHHDTTHQQTVDSSSPASETNDANSSSSSSSEQTSTHHHHHHHHHHHAHKKHCTSKLYKFYDWKTVLTTSPAPSLLSSLFSPITSLFGFGCTSETTNLDDSPADVIKNNDVRFFSHTAHNLATAFNYSIGSRESGFQCGIQRVRHTFFKSYSRQQQQQQQPTDNEQTPPSSPNLSLPSSHPAQQSQQPSNQSPFYHLSTLQQTLSFSTLKGIAFDHSLEFALAPTYSEPRQPWSLPQQQHHPTTLTTKSQPKFFLSLSLSSLLPFQLTEHFFRTHHMFPPLPELHQPYQEIDSTPCVQDVFSLHHHKGSASTADHIQQQQQTTTAPWYPADYTTSPHTHSPPINTTESNIPPHYAQYSGSSKNSDDVTRRLSLNTQNGEYRSISQTTATPSPIWNPYEGTKINLSFGWGSGV